MEIWLKARDSWEDERADINAINAIINAINAINAITSTRRPIFNMKLGIVQGFGSVDNSSCWEIVWSGPSFLLHRISRYDCHVTEKGRMSKLLKWVDIMAPGVVFNAKSDFDVGERIRPAGNFYCVDQLFASLQRLLLLVRPSAFDNITIRLIATVPRFRCRVCLIFLGILCGYRNSNLTTLFLSNSSYP